MNLFQSFYGKEGAGVAPEAPPKSDWVLFWRVLRREWWELIKLNVLFWAVSLPLITLPAALTAMHSITLAQLRRKNVYLWQDFWEVFRREFVRSLGCAAMLCGVAAAAVLGRYAYLHLLPPGALTTLMAWVCTFVLLVTAAAMLHAFPMLSATSLSVGKTVRNAYLLVFLCLPQTLLGAAAMALVVAGYVLLYPISAVLLPAILFSFCALVGSLCAWRCMQRFVIKEPSAQEPAA